MAIKNNQKIRDMVEILSPVGDEMIPVAKGGKNYKVALDTIAEYVGVEGGGVSSEIEAQVKENTENIAGNTSAIANLIQGKQDRITEGDGINLDRVNNELSIRLGTAEQTIGDKQQVVTIGGLTFNEKGQLCIKLGSNLTFGQYGSLDCTVEYDNATTSKAGLMSATDKVQHDKLWTFYDSKDDIDDAINKWQELENFLAGLRETDTLMAITSELQGQIDGLWSRNSFDELYIGHAMADSIATEAIYIDKLSIGDASIVQEENVGLKLSTSIYVDNRVLATEHWVANSATAANSLKLNGRTESRYFTDRGWLTAGSDLNDVVKSGIWSLNGDKGAFVNSPVNYGNLLTFGDDDSSCSYYKMQFVTGSGASLHFRHRFDNWTDWKTIAFTDSTVANATNADKLGGNDASYFAVASSVNAKLAELTNTTESTSYIANNAMTSASNAYTMANNAIVLANEVSGYYDVLFEDVRKVEGRLNAIEDDYLKSASIADMATKTWVGAQGFAYSSNVYTKGEVDGGLGMLQLEIEKKASKSQLNDYALKSSLPDADDVLSWGFVTVYDLVDYAELSLVNGQIDGLWSRNSFDDLYIGHAMADSIATERLYADIIDGNFEALRINDYNETGEVGSIRFSSNAFRFDGDLFANDYVVATEHWVANSATAANSLKLNGRTESRYFTDRGWLTAGSDLNDVVKSGIWSLNGDKGAFVNSPVNYGNLLTFGDDDSSYSYHKMQFVTGSGASLYFRHRFDNWTAWKTIAFTDSTVANANGLVASSNSNYGIALGSAKLGSGLNGMSAYPIASDYMSLGSESNYFYYAFAQHFQQSSDATLKNVIGDVGLTVREIANAPAVEFTWKRDGRKDVGTIAQYWKDVLPEVVSGEEGSMGTNYATLGVVSSIVLARSMETYEERISRLERENEELRTRVSDLTKRLNV